MRAPSRKSGFTTIEIVIVMSLYGVVLLSLVGMHLIALSAGAAAETSSIAANLARARMEELLALPPENLAGQNNVDVRREIPADGGRAYTVHTTVALPDPARLDLTVTVTWQLAYAGGCAAGSGSNCAGTPVTYSRALQTRVQAPAQP